MRGHQTTLLEREEPRSRLDAGFASARNGHGQVVSDAFQPEIVIYEPTPGGRPRLIGADYIVDAKTWNASHTEAPELNGQKFHYYPAPNRYGLDAFYTLHVWAWKDNPTGTFVNWHANVSCDAYDGPTK